jgi:hypothetical protein
MIVFDYALQLRNFQNRIADAREVHFASPLLEADVRSLLGESAIPCHAISFLYHTRLQENVLLMRRASDISSNAVGNYFMLVLAYLRIKRMSYQLTSPSNPSSAG